MEVKLNINNILTTIIIALVLYIGQTVYELDKEMILVNYKMEQIHTVLQDISENKKDKE